MVTDNNDRAWKRLAVSLAEALPGEWAIGRPGNNCVLVRIPVDWTFTWIGVERSRKIDDPGLIVGRVGLIGPFRFGYHHGERSDVFGGPGTVDLTADNAEQTLFDFITGYGLPQVDLWDAIRMAETCEAQYGRPEAEWGRPIVFPEAAGWRLVFDTGFGLNLDDSPPWTISSTLSRPGGQNVTSFPMTRTQQEARTHSIDLAQWLASWKWPIESTRNQKRPRGAWPVVTLRDVHGRRGLLQQQNIAERRAAEGPEWQPGRDPVPGVTRGREAERQPERDAWLADLSLRLEQVRARAGEQAATYDLSPPSLTRLAELVLADYSGVGHLHLPSQSGLVDAYASYLGEVLRQQAGGQWKLRPGEPDENNPHIGRPYLERVDHDATTSTKCPSCGSSNWWRNAGPSYWPKRCGAGRRERQIGSAPGSSVGDNLHP